MLFDEEMKSTKTTRSTTTTTNNNTAAAVATTITTTSSISSRPIMSEIEEPVKIKIRIQLAIREAYTSTRIMTCRLWTIGIMENVHFSLHNDGFDLFRRFPASTRLFNGL